MDEIVRLANQYDALVMVDECHSAGVVGLTGRGVTEKFNIRGEVDIITEHLESIWWSGGRLYNRKAGDHRVVAVNVRDPIFSLILFRLQLSGAGIKMFENDDCNDRASGSAAQKYRLFRYEDQRGRF